MLSCRPPWRVALPDTGTKPSTLPTLAWLMPQIELLLEQGNQFIEVR